MDDRAPQNQHVVHSFYYLYPVRFCPRGEPLRYCYDLPTASDMRETPSGTRMARGIGGIMPEGVGKSHDFDGLGRQLR